jgi:hypothetical protein
MAWTTDTVSSRSDFLVVGYGDGVFVSATPDGEVFTSFDGIALTLRTPNPDFNPTGISCYRNRLFLITVQSPT